MRKPSPLRRLRFSTQDILADALMNSIFLLMFIGLSSLFLVTSTDRLYLYFMCYLLAIPAAAFFLLRRIRLSLAAMILLHLAFALMFSLLSALVEAAIPVASAAVISLMIYSFISISRKTGSSASPSLLILSFFIHLFCLSVSSMRGESGLNPFLTSGFLISVCLYLAIRQIYSFRNGFDHFLSSPTQPGKHIQANNNRIILLLCLVIAIIFPLSIVFPYGFLVDAFKFILAYIVRMIAFLISLLPVMRENKQEADPESTQGRILDDSRMSNGILSMILDTLVMVLFIFIVVYAFIRFVPLIISFLRNHFRIWAKETGAPGSQYITDETIDLDKSMYARNKKFPAFGTGEERKIRKEYYKQVKEAMAEGAAVTGASSTGEIRNTLLDQLGKDISDLTARYEKVRYGPRSQSHTGRSSRKR